MGGKSKGTKSTTAPWAGQQPWLLQGFEDAGMLRDMGPIHYAEGDLVADRSDVYNQADRNLVGWANQFGRPGGIYDQTRQAHTSALNAPDIANNPYVQGMMEANQGAIMRTLGRDTLPGLEDAAQMAGQYGGSRHGVADALALGEAQQAIGDSNARIMNQAYGQGLTAQANAMNQAGALAQMGLMPMQVRRDVGLGQQAQQQAEMDANVQREMFNRNAGWTNLQNYMSAIGGNYGSMSTNKQSGGGGGLGGAMSGALAGAQLGSLVPGIGPLAGSIGGGILGLFA